MPVWSKHNRPNRRIDRIAGLPDFRIGIFWWFHISVFVEPILPAIGHAGRSAQKNICGLFPCFGHTICRAHLGTVHRPCSERRAECRERVSPRTHKEVIESARQRPSQSPWRQAQQPNNAVQPIRARGRFPRLREFQVGRSWLTAGVRRRNACRDIPPVF